jgi:fused signal recognition particle receptor
MDPILYVLLAVVAAAVGWWIVRGRAPALPGATTPDALPPGGRGARSELGPDTEPGDEPEPDTEPGITRAPAPSAPATPASPAPMPRERPPRERAPQTTAAPPKSFEQGLAKTRGGFVARLAKLLRGKPKVDADLRDQVEEVLFTADIGATTAAKLLARVTEVLDRKEVAEPDAVWAAIAGACLEVLEVHAAPPQYDVDPKPYVLLAIGVNGVGKTTTLGKLAAMHVAAGRKVLLVAGDTFRAAATEQLDVWARRVGCDIHIGRDKADPSSVIYDGITRGRREGHDVVLCDTAGRLHTRTELMDELGKVGRAAAKAIAKGLPAPESVVSAHDTYLVLDATIGQNALAQAKMFKETMNFTGLVVTKLDGTAKGGVVLGICDEMEIPIRFIGIGEGIEDLRAFDPHAFTDALLARDAGGDAVA